MRKEIERSGASQAQAETARSPVNGAQSVVAPRLPGVNAGPKTATRQSPVNGARELGAFLRFPWRQTARGEIAKALAIVLTLALGVLAKAEEARPEPDAQARLIAPFLSPQTIAV